VAARDISKQETPGTIGIGPVVSDSQRYVTQRVSIKEQDLS
jgi:hypothetical protein